ncbi:hypothetical protein [Alkalihalobacillus sp. 1P02AB]|uniref:hypothetical protein n=1 Tax=Alkalihalobacillus sp. 1P02AB TaxID=3132260 RepID=UPI0039A4F7BB
MSFSNGNERDQVETMVKEIQIEAKGDFKEKTFKLLREEVEVARQKQAKKPKWLQFLPAFGIVSSVITVSVIAAILIVSSGGDEPIGIAGDDKGEAEVETEREPEVNESIEEDLYGSSDREAEMVMEVQVEGMTDERVYQLLDHEQFPFSTYYSAEFWQRGTEFEEYYKSLFIYSNIDPETKIEVAFYEADELTQAEALFEQLILTEFEQIEEVTPPEQAIKKVKINDKNNYSTSATLYESQGFYFSIYESSRGDFWDGWSTNYEVLIEEWQWKSDGSGL